MKLLDLFEILNSKKDVIWNDLASGYVGKFEHNGSDYQIHLDEFDANILNKIYHLVDVGFTKNGNWDIQKSDGKASEVLGIVLNAISEKLKMVKPDVILFGLNYKNGATESRASLYAKLARLYVRGSSFSHESDWIETKNGKYKLLSRESFSEEQMKYICDTAAQITPKE